LGGMGVLGSGDVNGMLFAPRCRDRF